MRLINRLSVMATVVSTIFLASCAGDVYDPSKEPQAPPAENPFGEGFAAGLNILLTDFHRLFSDDTLLPAGRLREPESGKNRAHIVIVTKCPEDIKPIDFNIITKRLKLYPYQQLYFSSFRYGALTPLFGEKRRTLASLEKDEQVLLVTGIASPAPLVEKLKVHTPHVNLCQFDDHHDFSSKDLQAIKERFERLEGKKKLIITTEKDATRLQHHPALAETLKPYLYILPIEIEFLQNQQHIFNQNIIAVALARFAIWLSIIQYMLHQHQNPDLHHQRDLIVEQLQGLFLGRSILT